MKKVTEKVSTKGSKSDPKRKTSKKPAKKEDLLLKYFADGEPNEILMLNEVRPIALKGLHDSIASGKKILELQKSLKVRIKEVKKGTPEHRKYSFLAAIVAEVIEARDKAKAGDEPSRRKLVNWKFVAGGNNGDKEK